MLGQEEKPDVTYSDVGGMDSQKQETREAVDLPLTHFDMYKKIGIDPPRGMDHQVPQCRLHPVVVV